VIRRPSITSVSVLVAIGAAVLASVAYEGVDATRELLREQRVTASDGLRVAYDCLTEGFRQAVPSGTRVLLRTAAPDDETLQRIVESTYPDYEFVARRADAELVVRVTPRSGCRPKVVIMRIS
jgi:hypothetical protein